MVGMLAGGLGPVCDSVLRLLRQHAVSAALLALCCGVPTTAQAQVIWEDYQGNSSILGTSNQDLPGPTFANATGTDAQIIAALKIISANAANATRTGTATSINFTTASGTLCNTDPGADTAGTGAACQADAQGRVLWTVLKFPAAGNYTFSVAHDDQVDIDMSTT